MPAKYAKDLAEHVQKVIATQGKGDLPSLQILEELFEQLYFASLQTEEGENVICRVAYIDSQNPDPNPPDRIVKQRWQYHRLGTEIELNTRNLIKLSKAVDPWASTLAVHVSDTGGLRIWGLIDQVVHQSTFVHKESDAGPETPGSFQVSAEGVGEIAVHRGYIFVGRLRQNILVTSELAALDYGPVNKKLSRQIEIFQSKAKRLVGDAEYDRRGHWNASLQDEWITALSRILIGVKRYGHGGAVLLSDKSDGLTARYDLKYPRLSDALDRLASLSILRTSLSDNIHEKYLDSAPSKHSLPLSLYRSEKSIRNEIEETQDEITGGVRFLSSLSRVDGLLWFSQNLSLQGFGVLIQTSAEPEKVFRSENARGTKLTEIDIHNFGTRHRSMMRQCHFDPEAVGFVVSQDGDVRAITSLNNKVIIWENIRLQRQRNAKQVSNSGSDGNA